MLPTTVYAPRNEIHLEKIRSLQLKIFLTKINYLKYTAKKVYFVFVGEMVDPGRLKRCFFWFLRFKLQLLLVNEVNILGQMMK